MKNVHSKASIVLGIAILLGLGAGVAGAHPARQDDGALPPTIITFSADPGTVTVDEAESGQKPVELSWYTTGVTEAHRLEIQGYDLDAWTPCLPDAGPLPAAGSSTIPVKHPADFGPPTYRLVIRDAAGQIVDERILTIPYTAAPAGIGPVTGGSAPPAPEIRHFAADVTSLDIDALREQPAPVTVSWQVDNRTPTSNLVFEQVLGDGRAVAVEKPRAHLWVPSEGQGSVALLAPDTAGAPLTLRLRVIDLVNGEVLDEATLAIELIDASAGPGGEASDVMGGGYILSFSTETETLDAKALEQGTARATVAWQVVNRPPDTDLVFEQILPDGGAIPVGLPGAPSAGRGEIAPALPSGAAAALTLRLRLVDRATGETLDARTLALDIFRSPQLSFTATATPTAEPSQGLRVVAFAAAPDTVTAGGTVTLRWEVSGAASVALSMQGPSGAYTDARTDLAGAGAWEVAIPEAYGGAVIFQLSAAGAGGAKATARTSVTVACRHVYFFAPPSDEAGCPAGEATTAGAVFQVFEGGYMIRRADTGDIYVLINESSRLERYPDTWTEGETVEISETPPGGLAAPERGLGKVWAGNGPVRAALGWATGPAQNYTMQAQASAAEGARTYFTWPLDARTLYVAGDTWGFVP
ncbi:MAG: hypothetical protein JXB47_07700 [Anaerolineae bacterium]|nr:hypothetical protein [Anaerolineae bacterium]